MGRLGRISGAVAWVRATLRTGGAEASDRARLTRIRLSMLQLRPMSYNANALRSFHCAFELGGHLAVNPEEKEAVNVLEGASSYFMQL